MNKKYKNIRIKNLMDNKTEIYGISSTFSANYIYL